MKIVRFNDGKYAIRKWFLGYLYFNLKSFDGYERWVCIEDAWFNHCTTYDIDILIKRMNPEPPEPIDYGTPIDTDEESFWNKIKNNKKKLTKLQDKVSIKLTELDEAIEERDE